MRYKIPKSYAGMRVGLLGGSFDPAHEGHLNICLHSLKRFQLDQIWLLVSPGNPMKNQNPLSLNKRMDHAKNIFQHPKIKITNIETQLKTRFTYHTLLLLKQLYPSTNFTWIMGADNMAQVHLWQDWKIIFSLMPVGVLARPGQGISARLSPAARKFATHQISESCSWKLGGAVAPAWCFVNLPMSQISSSEIRSLGLWG